jgi:heterodisulfide reductase subunit C
MRLNLTVATRDGTEFVRRVEAESGQKVADCYQCGKCTAGCPVTFAMDLMPHQVVRLLQLGLGDEILESKTIWLCSTCATCTTRCPRNIDLARLMDTLRSTARSAGRTKAGKGIAQFNEVFLDSVRRYGRAHELGIGLRYNLKTGKLFKDSDLARGWFLRGRLKVAVPKIRGVAEIDRIFNEIKRMEGGK